jgi:hypothetical protein
MLGNAHSPRRRRHEAAILVKLDCNEVPPATSKGGGGEQRLLSSLVRLSDLLTAFCPSLLISALRVDYPDFPTDDLFVMLEVRLLRELR